MEQRWRAKAPHAQPQQTTCYVLHKTETRVQLSHDYRSSWGLTGRPMLPSQRACRCTARKGLPVLQGCAFEICTGPLQVCCDAFVIVSKSSDQEESATVSWRVEGPAIVVAHKLYYSTACVLHQLANIESTIGSLPWGQIRRIGTSCSLGRGKTRHTSLASLVRAIQDSGLFNH